MSTQTWKEFLEGQSTRIFNLDIRRTFVEKYAEYDGLTQRPKAFMDKVEEKHFTEIYALFSPSCEELKNAKKGKFEILGQWLKNQWLKDQSNQPSVSALPQPELPQQTTTKLGNLSAVTLRESEAFFGRAKTLAEIHVCLQKESKLALVGMGGVGKTEAAIQYAHDYATNYPGGTWWLSVPRGDIKGQVLSITLLRFPKFPVDVCGNLTPEDLVQRCWQEWRGNGRALILFDDVANLREVQAFLPRHKDLMVLLTSREEMDMPLLRLDVLNPVPALQLLLWAMGKAVPEAETLEECLAQAKAANCLPEAELAQAPALCKEVGYLPLALELIGKYLKQEEAAQKALPIPELRLGLQGKMLRHGALRGEPQNWQMTGKLSVSEALKLSWERLRDSAKLLAELLVPYQTGAVIAHDLLAEHTVRYWRKRGQNYDRDALRDDLGDLRNRSLLKENAATGYGIHPLVHEFFKDKFWRGSYERHAGSTTTGTGGTSGSGLSCLCRDDGNIRQRH